MCGGTCLSKGPGALIVVSLSDMQEMIKEHLAILHHDTHVYFVLLCVIARTANE